jgi:sterol desaturase/sphingolipid hydroxylase (fatty acid hydroxylase superfamily)
MPEFAGLLVSAGAALWKALVAILVPAPFFVLLALILKGKPAIADARRAIDESRTNLLIHFLDSLVTAPFLAVLAVAMRRGFDAVGLDPISPGIWSGVPIVVVGLAAVVAGDFVGYWRHRLEHTQWLWPSHAIHHSDTEMTWLTLFRFHPVNRLSTFVVDFGLLTLLGFPPYALLINNFVRHYYGMVIHADLPWTYGRLGNVFVSPAMHRWHHAKDRQTYNTNFATVFSLFDRAFGTFRVPGPCTVPLGVADDMGSGVVGQLAYPFHPSRYRFFRRSGPAAAESVDASRATVDRPS